jgi:hypothetical protein
MLLHGPDEGLRSGDSDAVEDVQNWRGLFRRYAPGPSIGDYTLSVDGAEVAAYRDVARLQGKLNPEGGEGSSAYPVLQRIETEQRQVTGAAAGSHPRRDRYVKTRITGGQQRVHVGGTGRLQFGQPA